MPVMQGLGSWRQLVFCYGRVVLPVVPRCARRPRIGPWSQAGRGMRGFCFRLKLCKWGHLPNLALRKQGLWRILLRLYLRDTAKEFTTQFCALKRPMWETNLLKNFQSPAKNITKLKHLCVILDYLMITVLLLTPITSIKPQSKRVHHELLTNPVVLAAWHSPNLASALDKKVVVVNISHSFSELLIRVQHY